jgi:hypothetical protein
MPAFAGRQNAVQRHGTGGAFAVEAGPLGLAAGGGRPLPDAVRGKMEAALGADFSNVRVYVGPQAERIGAIAFTVGSDIYFAPGRYQPETVHGQQLLGHELAHVVQQRSRRVKNPLGSGLAVVQDHALEAEADHLGQRAAAHRVVSQVKMPPGAAQAKMPAARSGPWGIGNSSPVAAPGGNPGAYSLASDPRCIKTPSCANLGTLKGNSPPNHRLNAIQRRPMHTAQITGLTHLREVRNRSLVSGRDYAEVKFPETVTIDKGDKWNSHLGIDLSQTKLPANLWYRVVSYQGKSIRDREVYVRAEMIKDLGLSSEELLARLAKPKVFKSPEIEIQKDIVKRLEKKSAQMPTLRKTVDGKLTDVIADNFLIGGIVLPVSANIVTLIRDAKFVRLKDSMVKVDAQYLVANDTQLQKLIINNMMATLLTAGQLDYLSKSGLSSDKQWRVFVEIHYYRSRSKDVSSFHKDTVGKTLFVNLNYAIGHKIAGPEYVVNPLLSQKHEDDIKSTLPEKYRADLGQARHQLKQPTEIGATKVPAYGVVSFVDELIHHMTPLYGPRTVYYDNVAKYLEQKWGRNEYLSAVALYNQFMASKQPLEFRFSKTVKQQVQINVISQLELAHKSTHFKHFNRKQLSDMGLSEELIDELIDTQSNERVGFRSAYIHGAYVHGLDPRTPVVSPGTQPLKRRMSEWALRGEIPPEVTGDRRFFRSNVQVIKATDLGNLVDAADLKKL